MQGGPPPFVICPRCTTVMLGGIGYCPRCGLPVGFQAPGVRLPPLPVDQPRWDARLRTNLPWRRTRAGLFVSALGLLLVWLPWLSIIGALLISLGSSLMFLGARASDRRHRVAVAVAFLAFAVGAVIIVFLLGAFLLRAFQIAGRESMATLRPDASLLQWGSLPGTSAIALGLALQVTFLLAPRERGILFGLTALLIVTAYVATALAEPEIRALGLEIVRTGPVLDLLSRLSVYRIVEAPAYLGLAVVYLFAHRSTMAHPVRSAASSAPQAP